MLVTLLISPLVLNQSMIVTGQETEDIYYSLESSVTYVNPADSETTWNLTEDDWMIGLFMNNSWQNVELKNASYALASLDTDADGNEFAVLDLPTDRLLPGENMTATSEYQIVAKPRAIPDISENASGMLGAIPAALINSYATDKGPWLLSDPELTELAHDIAGTETNVLTIVKKAVSWIKSNIAYRTHDTPVYANQTLREKFGDCDDQAVLLITLLRILGIPSYLQIGAIYYPQNAMQNETLWNDQVTVVQRKIVWHGWAEVYIPPWGWLPVDLTVVYGGPADPLNSIRNGAVTRQATVQYMNISEVDYVADSVEAKDFILENGFLLYYEDEMTVVSQETGVNGLDPIITVILIVALAVPVLLVTVMIMRRRKRMQTQQEPS